MGRENVDFKKRMYSSSCISDVMGCPRMFYYNWVRNLEEKVEKPALTFGRVFHDVLKCWYKTGNAEEAIKLFQEIPSNIQDSHRTKEWGEAIFKQYITKYKTEPYKVLYLEKQFVVEIGERLYAGTVDEIAEWNGQIYVVDHKTTRSLGLSFFDGFRPSPQIDGYCFSCREICGKCHGAIINGISVAKNPKDRFQRYPSSRTDKELDRWRDTFTQWTDIIEACLQTEVWPMNTSYCSRWGKCRFWELCVYGDDPKLVEAKFKIREEEKNVSKKESSGNTEGPAGS